MDDGKVEIHDIVQVDEEANLFHGLKMKVVNAGQHLDSIQVGLVVIC